MSSTATGDLLAATDEMSALFRAGRHQAVLARTFDAATSHPAPEHAPYVVGSLALLGRLEEALAFAKSIEDEPATPSSVSVPVRFFAIVGLCHSGRYGEARRWVIANASHTRGADPTTRFFAFQGLALFRYFTGDVGRARLSARRALEEAVAARFPYGRLLALDLSGHVLVQRGEVSAGLRVLEQAERLAHALGAPGHGTSIECARLAYENRHGRGGEELESALSRVAVTSVDNLYALRAAWLELSFRSAICGDAIRAREALERAREQALPERDHRARARLLIVQAILARLDATMEDVRSALREAAAALDRGEDLVLRTELLVWDRVLRAGALGARAGDAREMLRRGQTLAAEVLLSTFEGQALAPSRRNETPLFALLASRSTPSARVETIVQRGWLGLVPLLFAPAPGRYLFFVEHTLFTSDRGTVSEQARLPGHAREILDALREGPRTKEELVRDVWRVPRYAAQLHDPVVHTAIARVRRAMGTAADWLETTPTGYALRADVQVVIITERAANDVPMEAPTRPPSTAPRPGASARARAPVSPRRGARGAPASGEGEDDLLERIAAALTERPVRAKELADRLRVSEATALRRLRLLTARGDATRKGAGKLTRYRRT